MFHLGWAERRQHSPFAVGEFKTVAKSVSISHDGSLLHWPKWETDAQIHYLPDRHLDGQDSRHSRFAHFYRHAGNQTERWRPDGDIDF